MLISRGSDDGTRKQAEARRLAFWLKLGLAGKGAQLAHQLRGFTESDTWNVDLAEDHALQWPHIVRFPNANTAAIPSMGFAVTAEAASPALRAGRLLADILVLAVLIHLMFVTDWLSRGVQQLAQRRAGAALVMHGVVRAGIKEEAAALLASKCEQQGTGISARVIGEAEARGMLALQESWMSELPNVEISRLPTLLEVRIAANGIHSATVRAFRDWLSRQSEIEFVEFNDTGLEDLLSFTTNVEWYAQKLRDWFVVLAAIAIVLYAARTSAGRAVRLMRSLVVLLAAIALAYVGLQILVASARSQYSLGGALFAPLLRDAVLAACAWLVSSIVIPLFRKRVSSPSAG